MKCDSCGKFRKEDDLRLMEADSSDGYPGEQWLECRNCMSKADRERYYPAPASPESEE